MNETPKQSGRWFRFSLLELGLLVALIAGGFAVYGTYHARPNSRLLDGVYIAVFSIATVAIAPWPSISRRPTTVFALFGWVFLLFLVASNAHYVWNLQSGMAMAVLTALAAYLCFSRLD
jgi:hypothetical protein